MSLKLVRNDITTMAVDAIVNAANTDLEWGGGVCGAIFEAAGGRELQAACDKLSPIKTGEAVITPGFKLLAKFIIHAAGPVYRDQTPAESEALLRKTYLSALQVAKENKCESVAFPLISSGIYGYPKEAALRIATEAIKSFLAKHELEVYLILFNREAFLVGRELHGAIESYIDEHYVETHSDIYRRGQLLDVERVACKSARLKFPHRLEECRLESLKALSLPRKCEKKKLLDVISELDVPFNLALLRVIYEKQMTDVQVYKGANLSRKLFSKIRTGKGYVPSKRTVLALAVSMRLDLAETTKLLSRAGYALTHNQKFDVIVEYFIVNQDYDIFKINQVLFDYDQPLLGSDGV